jgi:hypothetical protein
MALIYYNTGSVFGDILLRHNFTSHIRPPKGSFKGGAYEGGLGGKENQS